VRGLKLVTPGEWRVATAAGATAANVRCQGRDAVGQEGRICQSECLGSNLVWGKDDEGFEGSVDANSMVGVSIGSEHAWGRTSRVLIS